VEHQDFEEINYSSLRKGDIIVLYTVLEVEVSVLALSKPVVETIAGQEYLVFSYLNMKENTRGVFLDIPPREKVKRLINE
jgi:hypothetical protein